MARSARALSLKRTTHRQTEYVTLRVAERFERKLTETAKVWQLAEWLPKVDDFSDYRLNIEIGIEAAISKAFSVRVVATTATTRSQPRVANTTICCWSARWRTSSSQQNEFPTFWVSGRCGR